MTEAGGARPDVVVDLPGGGEILIDAKFPFDAYWRAIKADDEVEIDAHLHKHAEDVLARAEQDYDRLSRSPEAFVSHGFGWAFARRRQ